MKSFLALFIVYCFTQVALADESENKVFSGLYTVESCSPSCDQVETGISSYVNYVDFGRIKWINISVEDKLPSFWTTCDGSSQAFEFNLWTVHDRDDKPGYDTGHFMNNNLEVDSANPWRNVCDGKFKVSGKTVSLKSPEISITLKKVAEDKFNLEWNDQRWGIEGVFKLKKAE